MRALPTRAVCRCPAGVARRADAHFRKHLTWPPVEALKGRPRRASLQTKQIQGTMTETDQVPRGQVRFGEALATLRENLKQEGRANLAFENARDELRRVYWGWDAPEPSSPTHALWVRQHAAMDSAKCEAKAAIEARPALVRLVADAASSLAVRADKSPEGLRASAAKLAVELNQCAPRYNGEVVGDVLRRLSGDVEALALIADAAQPSDRSPTVVGASDQVTIQDIADETGIPYSTLSSRRLRLPADQRPKPVGKDTKRRDLYRRDDWDKIIEQVRGSSPDA